MHHVLTTVHLTAFCLSYEQTAPLPSHFSHYSFIGFRLFFHFNSLGFPILTIKDWHVSEYCCLCVGFQDKLKRTVRFNSFLFVNNIVRT